MAWTKRKVEGTVVMLGKGKDKTQTVQGLLAAIKKTKLALLYELVQDNGESFLVYGCTDIYNQVGADDIGKFVKMTYTGEIETKSGNPMKLIDCNVWSGPLLPEMESWPRLAEFVGDDVPRYIMPMQGEEPKQLPAGGDPDPEDDDLPF